MCRRASVILNAGEESGACFFRSFASLLRMTMEKPHCTVIIIQRQTALRLSALINYSKI